MSTFLWEITLDGTWQESQGYYCPPRSLPSTIPLKGLTPTRKPGSVEMSLPSLVNRPPRPLPPPSPLPPSPRPPPPLPPPPVWACGRSASKSSLLLPARYGAPDGENAVAPSRRRPSDPSHDPSQSPNRGRRSRSPLVAVCASAGLASKRSAASGATGARVREDGRRDV